MVDKLYIMLPEFKLRKEYDIKAAWDDFYTDPENADISEEIERRLEWGVEDYKSQHPDDEDLDIDDYFEFLQGKGVKKYQLSENAQKRFSKWFKARKSNYFLGRSIEKVRYDYDKLPQEQSQEARNNALIDMMWGILTNPDTASKMLNPGGFDKQKMAARVVTILDSMTEAELAAEGYTIADILKMSKDTSNLKALDKLASKTKRKLDPLSPRTQVTLHQQNMTGGKMIGIYANHNANHALMQHTQLAVDDKAVQIAFCDIGQALNTARSKGVAFRDTLTVPLQRSSGIGVAKCDCCIIGAEEVLIALPQNPHLTKFRVVEHFEVQGFVFAHLTSFLFEAVSVARSP